MRNYTEPNLQVVAIKAQDVITTSNPFFALFKKSGIEDGGRAVDLSSFETGGL
mgnify:FL=1